MGIPGTENSVSNRGRRTGVKSMKHESRAAEAAPRRYTVARVEHLVEEIGRERFLPNFDFTPGKRWRRTHRRFVPRCPLPAIGLRRRHIRVSRS